jgi:hypothetical protein
LYSKQSGAFHRRAGHVLQAFIAGGRGKTQSLAFQEYHPGYPHVKHTMGYAGTPVYHIETLPIQN